jgi:RNA polymerase sigma-70 factor (ECF subfamily)
VCDDAERFRALFESELVAIVGYAARRLDDPTDAADVAADVFVIAWRRIRDVPPGPEARLWLYGVARNVLSNHTRSARRRIRLVDRLRHELHVLPAASTPAPGDVIALRQALSELREDDRELLLLATWEGLSPSQIASVLQVPPGTVRSRLHRARKALRLALTIGDDASELERTGRRGHVAVSEQPLAARHEDFR